MHSLDVFFAIAWLRFWTNNRVVGDIKVNDEQPGGYFFFRKAYEEGMQFIAGSLFLMTFFENRPIVQNTIGNRLYGISSPSTTILVHSYIPFDP